MTAQAQTLQPHPLPSNEHNPWQHRWLVAYTKPRAEAVALQNLEQQGFEAYFPKYKKFKTTEAGPAPVFEPMFPRYIFFRPARPEQSIAAVRSTKGISNIVRFGFEPGVVPSDMLAALKDFEAAQNQATLQDMSNFKAGQKVKFKHAALGSLEGLIQSVSSKRVAVLLEIMGRSTVVQMAHHQLEEAL